MSRMLRYGVGVVVLLGVACAFVDQARGTSLAVMIAARDLTLKPRRSGDSTSAIIRRVEHAGDAFPASPEIPAQARFPKEYDLGGPARRCADVGRGESNRYDRSGEFIMWGFFRYWSDWVDGGGVFRYRPLHIRDPLTDSIVITFTRLDRDAEGLSATLRGTHGMDSFGYFFAHNYRLPAPGRWLILVQGSADWGCFLYEFPVVGALNKPTNLGASRPR